MRATERIVTRHERNIREGAMVPSKCFLKRWILVGAGLALTTAMMPATSDAQNLLRARLFRGGFNAGPPGGWPGAPTSVDDRVWPPACGVKLSAATPGTDCEVPYFGSHPANPLYPPSGMNGANITFDAAGWDLRTEVTILGNPGFPVIQLANSENFGLASFGPGMGVGQAGTHTFRATGLDPATLGTQTFTYDPLGLTDPEGPQVFKWPPNSAATTPRPLIAPPNHGGMIRVTTGPERFGGTLAITGVSRAYVVQTFNPGVATTGIIPVQNSPGSPIPVVTPVSGLTVPGATFINRKKGVEPQRVRTNMGITPGGFVSLGATVGSANSFQMREQGPWTTGMVTLTEMDRPGVFPTTTVRTETGGKNTVNGVGTIQLVQPWIARSANGGGINGTGWSHKLILDVPEPAAGLIAGGLAGFVLIGLHRRKNRT